ncbi:transglycosylase domain-containing protein [Gorillibacterium massiliense]|uniref:transglycosylase domain-containing protein n=1 Tax=Gorillibacterium massiliense TaxID=1280390 RepID=UPI0004B96D95|nr:PBP1A family penicillin-binding protein [Gorillibacterium massiliense]
MRQRLLEEEKKSSFLIRRMIDIKRFIVFLFSAALVLAAVLVLAFLYLRSQPLPASSVLQSSQIFDANGTLISSLETGRNQQAISLDKISPYLIKATLDIEDHRFYEHPGIDPKGLLRAVVTDVRHLSMEQGASTITQQLARNLYLSHERTWTRKVKEAIYAIQLELQYSKNQILERYLNQIYFGHSAYGVEAAAQMFYGKHASDLSLAEATLMAGVPKGPKYYSPYLNMVNAKSRQKNVLDAMVRYGDITRQQADEAYAEDVPIIPEESSKQQAAAPYFRDYVRQIVTEKLQISEPVYDSGGLKIYTTLDLSAQKIAEDEVTKQLGTSDGLQAALIALDPRTGYIKAMVGGKNYADNQFNRVFAESRQPGSSFKPIVYLSALSENVSPLKTYMDEPTNFPYDDGKKTYTPNNYGNEYSYEMMDMRKAISLSSNIYAVHTLMDVGPEKVIDTARRLGITSHLDPLPSLALGTYPVSPYEMAAAFASIANQGVRVEPTAVLRIEDSRGHVIYRAHPESHRAAEPAQAYVLTSLMESIFEEGGTGYRVSSLLKRTVAGKTGTTDSDAWMVGFTPELATAVWVGYDRGRTITPVEAHKAAPIFAGFTERTLADLPPEPFEIPEGVVTVYVDPVSGKLAGSGCSESKLEAFIAGTEPTEYCSDGSGRPPSPQGGAQSGHSNWWEDLKRWWNE